MGKSHLDGGDGGRRNDNRGVFCRCSFLACNQRGDVVPVCYQINAVSFVIIAVSA